jgi:hypothetical protein
VCREPGRAVRGAIGTRSLRAIRAFIHRRASSRTGQSSLYTRTHALARGWCGLDWGCTIDAARCRKNCLQINATAYAPVQIHASHQLTVCALPMCVCMRGGVCTRARAHVHAHVCCGGRVDVVANQWGCLRASARGHKSNKNCSFLF